MKLQKLIDKLQRIEDRYVRKNKVGSTIMQIEVCPHDEILTIEVCKGKRKRDICTAYSKPYLYKEVKIR